MKRWIHASTNASSIPYLPEYCKNWPDYDLLKAKPEVEMLADVASKSFAGYNWDEETTNRSIQTHVDKSLPWLFVRKYIRDVIDWPVLKQDADLAEELVKEFGPTKGEDIFREIHRTGETVDSVIQKYK